MDNTRLEYLCKVAEYGSIAKAADELFITSSALSKYIKKIEDEYGVPLFDRVGKRFELTYAGERYLSWLQNISSMYDEMDQEMKDIANSFTGRLRIGVQIGGAGMLLDDTLPEFFERFPNVRLEIHEDVSSSLVRMLDANHIDLAIIPDEGLTSSMEVVELMDQYIVLVTPKGHPIAAKAVTVAGCPYPWVDIRELADAKFIAPFEDQGIHAVFDKIAEEYSFRFRISLRTRTLSRMLRFVNNGLGVTLSPDVPVLGSPYIDRLDLFAVGDQSKIGDLVIAYNTSHYLSLAADAFIELCKKSLAVKGFAE